MEWTPEDVSTFRSHLGMGQQEFGELLGYSGTGANRRVSELERGQRGVSGPVGRLLDLLAERHGFAPSGSGPTAEAMAERLEAALASVGSVARAIREGRFN